MSGKNPDSVLQESPEETNKKIPTKQPLTQPEREFDYGETSKNLIEHEPIKDLFSEMLKSLTKDFFNTIEYDKDSVKTKNVKRKMNELLNHELLNDYITTHKLLEKEANKLFVLFIDKVLTLFIQLKTANLEQYPKDRIEILTTYLNELNEI